MNCCLLAEEVDINGPIQNSNIGNIKQSSPTHQISGVDNGKKKKKSKMTAQKKKQLLQYLRLARAKRSANIKNSRKRVGQANKRKKRGGGGLKSRRQLLLNHINH